MATRVKGAMDIIADDIRHRQDTLDKIDARQEQMQKALALQVQDSMAQMQKALELQVQTALDTMEQARQKDKQEQQEMQSRSHSEGQQRETTSAEMPEKSAEMPEPCTGRGASTATTAAGTEFAQLLQEWREDRHHTQSLLQTILQALVKQGGFSTESHNKENALQRSPGEGQQRETKSAELPETPSGEGNALQSSQGEGKQRETKSAEMPQSAARLRGQKRALNKMQVTEHAQPSMPRAHIQRSMQKAEAQRNVAPSKAHPGKLANARLQRHTLTLRANSRVRKKRIVQHRMPPL